LGEVKKEGCWVTGILPFLGEEHVKPRGSDIRVGRADVTRTVVRLPQAHMAMAFWGRLRVRHAQYGVALVCGCDKRVPPVLKVFSSLTSWMARP